MQCHATSQSRVVNSGQNGGNSGNQHQPPCLTFLLKSSLWSEYFFFITNIWTKNKLQSLLLFVRVSCRFQQFFSHIMTVSGCDRELNAHFYSAASLKYHDPDTWHDTTPSHIILTLGWPVLAVPRKS